MSIVRVSARISEPVSIARSRRPIAELLTPRPQRSWMEMLEMRGLLAAWFITPALDDSPYTSSQITYSLDETGYHWHAQLGTDDIPIAAMQHGTRFRATLDETANSADPAPAPTTLDELLTRKATDFAAQLSVRTGETWAVDPIVHDDGTFEMRVRFVDAGIPADYASNVIDVDSETFTQAVLVEVPIPPGNTDDYVIWMKVWNLSTGRLMEGGIDAQATVDGGRWFVRPRMTGNGLPAGDYVFEVFLASRSDPENTKRTVGTGTLRAAEVVQPREARHPLFRMWNIGFGDEVPIAEREWDGPADPSQHHGRGSNPKLQAALDALGLGLELHYFHAYDSVSRLVAWGRLLAPIELDQATLDSALRTIPGFEQVIAEEQVSIGTVEFPIGSPATRGPRVSPTASPLEGRPTPTEAEVLPPDPHIPSTLVPPASVSPSASLSRLLRSDALWAGVAPETNDLLSRADNEPGLAGL